MVINALTLPVLCCSFPDDNDDDDDDDDYDGGGGDGDDPFVIFDNTGGPPYSRVTRSKTHRSYVKLQIISNTTYNVIFL